MKQILILVSRTGETKLETRGFQGEECRAASRPLEQALGLASHEQVTAEFHQAAAQLAAPIVELSSQ